MVIFVSLCIAALYVALLEIRSRLRLRKADREFQAAVAELIEEFIRRNPQT